MDHQPPVLEYAPPAPRSWRRWIRRALFSAVIFAILASVVAGVLSVGTTLYWQWRVRARLEHLANYRRPPAQVVYDDDRGRMDSLLRKRNYDHFPGNFDNKTHRYAYYDDLGGRGVNIGVNPGGHAVLFLQRLQDTSGKSAVVEVSLDPWGTLGTWDEDPARRVWVLQAGIAEPYGGRDWLTLKNVSQFNDVLPFDINDPRPLKIFAGQPDPLDPSRFTIRYELGDSTGTIEGQLRSGGTVQLRCAGERDR